METVNHIENTKTRKAEANAKSLKYFTWRTIGIFLMAGIVLIFIGSLYKLGQIDWREWLSSIGVGLLIGGAALCAGGFMGFLFGIPSLQQNADQSAASATTFKYNDNLMQISDWLTKIIVGVGLTQLYKIPTKIRTLGDYLKYSFGGEEWGRNLSLAVVFYFLLLGFLVMYFWTRTDFTMILKYTDDDLQKKYEDAIAQKETLETELKTAEVQVKTTETQLETVKEENKITKEEMQAVVATFSNNLQETKSEKELAKANSDENNDPQKGKWGGAAKRNGRELTATVRPASFNSDFYNIVLTVSSTEKHNPLAGKVVFHLHPTFPNNPATEVAVNGIAKLSLISYGSFTVGVECDFDAAGKAQTQLELDLADLPDVSQKFRET
jgi:hypothetical protein